MNKCKMMIFVYFLFFIFFTSLGTAFGSVVKSVRLWENVRFKGFN